MDLPDGSGTVKGIICGVCGQKWEFRTVQDGLDAVRHALGHGALVPSDMLPDQTVGRC